jgi:hypothetical protein
VPATLRLYVPGDAVVDAESVNFVLHVAVQVVEEKEAVTPAGNDEAANVTGVAVPVSSVAVTLSVVDCPGTMDKLEDAGKREKVVAVSALAEVVKV